MKIICLTRSLGLGGAERQIAGLASLLKAAGHDAELLVYHSDDFYGTQIEGGVRYCLIPKNGSSIGLVRRLVAHFREEHPDYVISFMAGPCFKGIFARMLDDSFKLVVSERNVNVSYMPHDMLRFLLFRKADLVVANSFAQAEFIKSHCRALAGKTHAIVNFVDLEHFVPKTPEQWDAGEGHRIRLVTTARVNRRKNIMGYIRAVSLLVQRGFNLEVHWYGQQRKSLYYRRCLKEIDKLGLKDVFFIDQAVNDVVRVYHEADVFVLPSFYEGTSNSMLEAMACGLPIVVSNVSDNAIYVKPGENGYLLDPHDVDSIASALGSALSLSREQMKQFGRNSRKTVEERNSKTAFIANYLRILE